MLPFDPSPFRPAHKTRSHCIRAASPLHHWKPSPGPTCIQKWRGWPGSSSACGGHISKWPLRCSQGGGGGLAPLGGPAKEDRGLTAPGKTGFSPTGLKSCLGDDHVDDDHEDDDVIMMGMMTRGCQRGHRRTIQVSRPQVGGLFAQLTRELGVVPPASRLWLSTRGRRPTGTWQTSITLVTRRTM